MIDFDCPKCARPLRVGDELAGKRARCSKCNSPIVVPPSPTGPVLVKVQGVAAGGAEDIEWLLLRFFLYGMLLLGPVQAANSGGAGSGVIVAAVALAGLACSTRRPGCFGG